MGQRKTTRLICNT